MSSEQSTVDFLTDQMTQAGDISSRKMFGEYALYCDGKVVALVCDDELFIKPIEAGRTHIGAPDEAPPYPGAKNYFHISGDFWDDAQWLSTLVKVTAEELPMPKAKKKAQKKV